MYAPKSSSKCPTKAKMASVPLLFQQIAMDVVWALTPRSGREQIKFILTICGYATHVQYPEALFLSSFNALKVARELIELFSHVSIPHQGTNFVFAMIEEIYCLLHITRIRTIPYHLQMDGLVERH